MLGTTDNLPEMRGDRRLGSWKEIAAYLGVTDRTARRWEIEEGLPVHRHWHDQRGTVWADPLELDAWKASRDMGRGDAVRAARQAELPVQSAAPTTRRKTAVLLASASVLVIASIALIVWQLTPNPAPAQMVVRGSLLGAPSGIQLGAVMSNDGRYVAYESWKSDGEGSSIVLLPRDGSPWRTVSESEGRHESPVFSPDGSRIAWWSFEETGSMRIRIALVSGGPPADVTTVRTTPEYFHRGQAMSWTADGRSLIAPHRPDNAPAGLFQFSLDGGAGKRLTSAPPGWRDVAPRVSADGRRLAFLRTQSWPRQDICLTDLVPGADAQCTSNPKLPKIFGLTWGPDGLSLIASMSHYQSGQDTASLWRLPTSDLLNGTELVIQTNSAVAPQYNPQSNTLVYTQFDWNADLFEYAVTYGAIPALREIRRIGPSDALETDPLLSPDGTHLAFSSERAGLQQLWVVGPGEQEPRQITRFSKEDLVGAVWSHDSASLGVSYAASPKPETKNRTHFGVVPLNARPQSVLGNFDISIRPIGWPRSGEWIYGKADQQLVRLNLKTGKLEECGNAGWIRYWPDRDQLWYRAPDGSYRILRGCGMNDADPVALRTGRDVTVANLVPTRRGVWIQSPTRRKFLDLMFLPNGASAPVRVAVSNLLPIGIEASPDGSRLFLVRMQELRATPMLAKLD